MAPVVNYPNDCWKYPYSVDGTTIGRCLKPGRQFIEDTGGFAYYVRNNTVFTELTTCIVVLLCMMALKPAYRDLPAGPRPWSRSAGD